MGTDRLKLARRLGGLAVVWSLAGCAQLSNLADAFVFAHDQGAAPEPMSQKVGRGVGTLEFAFEFDNKAEKEDGQVGAGYIVVIRDGKELQALPHVFELSSDQLDAKAWLEFADFNGDGLMDFKVARLAAAKDRLPLESVYQFDRTTGNYALVEALSGVGRVTATAPGCVSLTLQAADGEAKQESLCFGTVSNKWVFSKPGTGRDQLARAQVPALCDPLAPNLKVCQLARVEAEGRLQKLVQEYRAGMRKSLQKEQGKGYADAYAKTFDWDHLSWRRYRDARCAVQAREQALSPKELPAATALCRYDWTRDQLRRYQDQVAKLVDDQQSP